MIQKPYRKDRQGYIPSWYVFSRHGFHDKSQDVFILGYYLRSLNVDDMFVIQIVKQTREPVKRSAYTVLNQHNNCNRKYKLINNIHTSYPTDRFIEKTIHSFSSGDKCVKTLYKINVCLYLK